MKRPKRIGAFYSHGPHYARMLQYLREAYPGAEVTAILPPGFPGDALAGLAEKRMVTALPAYSIRNIRALRQLVRSIRAADYDLFVVMFDSSKLRLLSALGGARRSYCYGPDGRFVRIRLALTATLARCLYRNIRGRITYAYIHYIVHHRPVVPKKP